MFCVVCNSLHCFDSFIFPFCFKFFSIVLLLNFSFNFVVFSSFLPDNADLDLVGHALEEELSLVGDQFAFLGRLEGPHQRLVVIGNLVVVEELSKGRVGFALDPDPKNVDEQTVALLVEPVSVFRQFGFRA